MKRKLFNVGQTAITLHLATLLFGAYMALIGQGKLLGCGLLSITLHECAHAAAAGAFGCAPVEMEITPLGCLMRLEDENRLPPLRRLLMLLCGPACSALLALLSAWLTARGALDWETGRTLFCCNASILLVNLLPALPLDGGRMTALLLGLRLSGATVSRVMRALGTFFGALLVAANVAVCCMAGGWNLSLGCAGAFLLYAAHHGTATAAMEELKRLMDRKILLEKRGCLPIRDLAVLTTLPLRAAVASLRSGRYTRLLLLSPGTLKTMGRASEEQLITAYLSAPGETCQILVKNGD